LGVSSAFKRGVFAFEAFLPFGLSAFFEPLGETDFSVLTLGLFERADLESFPFLAVDFVAA
jgi:hypothetical protein